MVFNYYIIGISFNIKVFWESKFDDVIGWIVNFEMNILLCVVFSIFMLEIDKVNMLVLCILLV